MEYVIPPAGLVPAGVWAPEELGPPIVPAASLAEEIDPATGELSALVSGIHPVDAQVINRLRIVANRSAVYEGRGLDLSGLPKAMQTNGLAIEGEIRDTLASMVDGRLITIDRIYVGTTAEELGPGTSDMNAAVVAYTNRLTAKPELGKVPRR